MKTDRKPVWSCNEWDPLEEIIVGSVEGAIVPVWNPALESTTPSHAKWFFDTYGGQPFPDQMIEKASAELDGLVKVLEDMDVKVHRPTSMNYSATTTTPWW